MKILIVCQGEGLKENLFLGNGGSLSMDPESRFEECEPSRGGYGRGEGVDGRWTEGGRKVDGGRGAHLPSPRPIS